VGSADATASREAAARRSDRADRLHGSVAWIPAVSVSLLLSTDAGAAPPPLGRRRALAPRPIRSSEACRASRSRAPGAGLDPSRATRAPRAEQTWPGTARSRQQPSTSYAADATCGAPPLARLREAGELRPQRGREGCGDQSAERRPAVIRSGHALPWPCSKGAERPTIRGGAWRAGSGPSPAQSVPLAPGFGSARPAVLRGCPGESRKTRAAGDSGPLRRR
jgi:hypothetical protein